MSLTKYTQANVTNTKQFTKATAMVFGSIKERNNQIQQLLVLAVAEAAKVTNGQVGNNLDWLTRILVLAQETKGVNLTKMVTYVREELCCNTVSWNNDKSRLTKVAKKEVKLKYNLTPEKSWFDYGKKETVAKSFDYGKRVTSAIKAAMSTDKGGMTTAELMQAIIASGELGINDLMQAMETTSLDEAA